MSVLLADTQKQVQDLLVRNGLLTQEELDNLRDKAQQDNEPLFSLLVNEGHISNEELTKLIAQATNVPYVNLVDAKVNPKVLGLL